MLLAHLRYEEIIAHLKKASRPPFKGLFARQIDYAKRRWVFTDLDRYNRLGHDLPAKGYISFTSPRFLLFPLRTREAQRSQAGQEGKLEIAHPAAKTRQALKTSHRMALFFC